MHDAVIRRKMWTPESIHPVVTVTGSHQKTCVFVSTQHRRNSILSAIQYLQPRYVSAVSEEITKEVWKKTNTVFR